MRRAAIIEQAWNAGGPFIGPWKPNSIVTVQLPWTDVEPGRNVLFPQETDVGGLMPQRGLPIRWYQRADNSQTELAIPTVKNVRIHRTLDEDCAELTLTLRNQWLYDNGAAPANAAGLGRPGYFNPDHGDDPVAAARWGHQTNEWNGLLDKNAIIRTYQGYGGHGKTLADALADGNLLLTGVWIVDRRVPDARGNLVLSARDAGKLLVDQPLFTPLVPYERYPLKYWRHEFLPREVTATSGVFTTGTPPGTDLTPGVRAFTYADSSSDRWYGPNASIYGHLPQHAFDDDDTTFALSVGSSGPDKEFATVWWEYEMAAAAGVNAIWVHPWKGGYEMYVSIMENGVWQGEQTIPYNHEPLIGRQPQAVDTGADIAYVAMFQVPFEESKEFVLPRVYAAERVRLSFRHLYDSGLHPLYRYRAGIRELELRVTAGVGDIAATGGDGQIIPPIFYAADSLRDLNDPNRAGYITVSNYGFVDVFGDCREGFPTRPDDNDIEQDIRDLIATFGSDAAEVSSVALTPSGEGYWILYSRGWVRSFGDAAYYGDPFGSFDFEGGGPNGGINKAATIIRTNTGLGYWVITWMGEIFGYGDAFGLFPNVAPPGSEFFHGACAHPTAAGDPEGLYLIATNGHVETLGVAANRGDWDETLGVSNASQVEICIDIACTHDGGGYWILSTAGRVQPFGNAGDFGQINEPEQHLVGFDRYYHLLPTPTSNGYLLTDGDGQIELFGDVTGAYFGAPVPGTVGDLRFPGNYLDFTDIVRDILLWCGFWLRGATPYGQLPAVFGNLETTGMFSPEPLPDEMFDKKPAMDPITELKESVGYIFRVDDEGGARFEAPNWWGPGNFLYDGTHVADIFEIDEQKQLAAYQIESDDEDLRSRIIISSEDPTGGGASTVYSELIPNTADELRGILKPAMWSNGYFQSQRDQMIMAELIAMHIWFNQRRGSARCAANPCLGIDDQVRIWERATGETYLHYIRSMTTEHDLDSGTYMMDLETNWLGTGDEWLLTVDDPGDTTYGTFILSAAAAGWAATSESPKVQAGNFQEPT